jgi:glucokinase
MEILAADIGGTNARFAIATPGAEGVTLSHAEALKVAEHASLETAWEAYSARLRRPLPERLALAVATPIDGDVLKFTNSPWVIRPAALAERGGFSAVTLVNDFAAVAHAVAMLPERELAHVAGTDASLPATGAITVLGPGTGLGVALLLREVGGARIVPTEGGHMDFAPLDSLEDRMLDRLRARFRRVSVERIVSGPGLGAIHAALASLEGRPIVEQSDADLWATALAGKDALARAALDRWCLSLGAVAGDLALAHGASAVVLAGGLAARVAPLLASSGFHARFTAKGRFEARMAALPIRRVTFDQPGLLGAAAAFLAEHGR